MKLTVLLFTFLIAFSHADAQQDTIRVKNTDIIAFDDNSDTIKNAHVVIYDPGTNETSMECNYLNGKKNGLEIAYRGKKVWRQTTYKNGEKFGEYIVYHFNGIPERKENYESGLFVSGHCYSDEGNEILYFREPNNYVEQMPSPTFDMKKYLKQNLNYPETARKAGIRGTVLVVFIVKEDGTVFNATVAKGIDKACDDEAKRVIMKMPKWNPGMSNGKRVSVYLNQPINFK